MNKHWSFYNTVTGLLAPTRSSAPEGADVSSFAPPGCVPIEGDYDYRTQRVDLKSLMVVDDADLAIATEDARKVSAAQAAIDAAEIESGPRAVREALLELLPRNSPSRVMLQAIDEQIIEQRAVVSGKALADASSPVPQETTSESAKG